MAIGVEQVHSISGVWGPRRYLTALLRLDIVRANVGAKTKRWLFIFKFNNLIKSYGGWGVRILHPHPGAAEPL